MQCANHYIFQMNYGFDGIISKISLWNKISRSVNLQVMSSALPFHHLPTAAQPLCNLIGLLVMINRATLTAWEEGGWTKSSHNSPIRFHWLTVLVVDELGGH